MVKSNKASKIISLGNLNSFGNVSCNFIHLFYERNAFGVVLVWLQRVYCSLYSTKNVDYIISVNSMKCLKDCNNRT